MRYSTGDGGWNQNKGSFPRVEEGLEGDGKRILIAEDDGGVRELLAATLQGNYEVREAPDGGEALRIARGWQPHLVLLDVRMPVMDGIAACRALKADPATAATPVILITGQSDSETARLGLEAGADTFLAKPFKPLLLLERVRQVLTSAGGPSGLVITGQGPVLPEEMGLEQLRVYAREVASLYRQERQLRETAERTNQELQNRLREIASLNTMFQAHLNRRIQAEEAYQGLLAGLRSLLTQAAATLSQREWLPQEPTTTPGRVYTQLLPAQQ